MNPGVVLIAFLVAGHVVFLFVALGIQQFHRITVHPITLPAVATMTPPQTTPGPTPVVVGDIALAAVVDTDRSNHFLTIDRLTNGAVSVSIPPFSEVDVADGGEWRHFGVFYSRTNLEFEPLSAQLYFRARPLRP